jgi:hypothetical protein
MRVDTVPEIIRAAGDDAVRAYREFLDDPVRAASTRKLYRNRTRKFFHWTESRGLSLAAIDADALAAYSAEIGATKSRHEVTIYLTPVRGVLGHLARSGVLASDPCPKGQPNGRGTQNKLDGPAPTITLAELKRIVLEGGAADGWTESDEDFRAGLVMLAPLSIHSMDPAAVAAFTGVPEPVVREYAGRLIESGIWRPDGRIAADWFDSDACDLSFMLDVWVVTGELERKSEGRLYGPARSDPKKRGT